MISKKSKNKRTRPFLIKLDQKKNGICFSDSDGVGPATKENSFAKLKFIKSRKK